MSLIQIGRDWSTENKAWLIALGVSCGLGFIVGTIWF